MSICMYVCMYVCIYVYVCRYVHRSSLASWRGRVGWLVWGSRGGEGGRSSDAVPVADPSHLYTHSAPPRSFHLHP